MQKFRAISDRIFHEGIAAHKSENELMAMVMAIFLEILREEDLHLDREFLATLRSIAIQIHGACEREEGHQEKKIEAPRKKAHHMIRYYGTRLLKLLRKQPTPHFPPSQEQ